MASHAQKMGLFAAAERIASMRALLACTVLLMLQACASGLPSSGPRPASFDKAQWQYVADSSNGDGSEKLGFVLVDVDRKITSYLDTAEDKTYFVGTFTDRAPASDVLLGVGDTVRITIFEAGPGGLFVPAGGAATGGNYVTLPDQEVDKTGRISIPYADKDGDGGLVKVHGRRPAEVQQDIENGYSTKRSNHR